MISFSRINKQYGRQLLFVDASFQLNPGEKVGLVGPNGAGKTTLFRMIVGEETADDGEVSVPKKLTIGYFRQDVEEMSGRSVLDEAIAGSGRLGDLHHELESLQHAMADPAHFDDMDSILERFGEVQEEYDHMGGYALESQAREVLHGLGFDDDRIDGDVGELSGGWKMRVAMARVLLGRPAVLLMDEPTNHLDIESIVWLEDFLKSLPGALLMTSHDREFMNRIVSKVAEIDAGADDCVNRLTTDGGAPYFLAPGNHDVTAAPDLESPQRRQALGNYLQAMSQLIPPDNAQRRLAGYPTYAFGYGNTFVLALDSNIPNDVTQYEWAKGQLESLDRKRYVHVVALFHHPVFSSGPHGGSRIEPPTAALRTRYMPLFRAHHVKAVFVGHDHLFEHWVERYSDKAGRHRMDLVTTGGGGAPLYAYQGQPDLTQYLRTDADAKLQVEHLAKPGAEPGANAYHFVIVQVDGGRMDLEVVGVDWGSGFRPYRTNRAGLGDR